MRNELTKRLRELEAEARLLEPEETGRQAAFSAVAAYAASFLTGLGDRKAYRTPPERGNPFSGQMFKEDPVPIGPVLQMLAEYVDGPGINPASGGHLGYIPGGGIYSAALGDYLAAVTNRYAGVSFASPGAVQMENALIDWMAALVGYPATAAGALLSGGSIANLTALVTARDAAGVGCREVPRTVIYLTRQVHHCIDKALRIAGMSECIRRQVPMDAHYRMVPAALEAAVRKDREAGLNPWLVIASAGTTDTGMVDPLPAIGEIARQFGLWYHVDGAYGAFFALCEPGKKILRGMEMSDSLVMDPHKTLFLPYGLGAVLVRNRDHLLHSQHYQANYMQDAREGAADLSPADLSPELSKHFRGLRMWLPLMLHGLAPFRAALEEKMLLAQYFYENIRAMDGFEVGPFPDLSVVTYRYVPKYGDADAFNRRLVQEIYRDGRIFVSTTLLEGRYTLRMAAVAFRTHRDTIDLALEILQEKTARLAQM